MDDVVENDDLAEFEGFLFEEGAELEETKDEELGEVEEINDDEEGETKDEDIDQTLDERVVFAAGCSMEELEPATWNDMDPDGAEAAAEMANRAADSRAMPEEAMPYMVDSPYLTQQEIEILTEFGADVRAMQRVQLLGSNHPSLIRKVCMKVHAKLAGVSVVSG